MMRIRCTINSERTSVWFKVQKNCTALHLALLNNFCIATAKLNEQNHLEHPMTPAPVRSADEERRLSLHLCKLFL